MLYRERGFTLIELMVTIAIIGLLSSVIIASISASRINARDANRLREVNQYVTAFQLYQNDKRSYPAGSIQDGSYCLGDRITGTCWNAGYGESAALITELTNYITPPPAGIDGTLSYNGYLYSCTSKTGSVCQSYSLQWFMEKPEASCGAGYVVDADYGGNTWCQYVVCKLGTNPIQSGGDGTLYTCQ